MAWLFINGHTYTLSLYCIYVRNHNTHCIYTIHTCKVLKPKLNYLPKDLKFILILRMTYYFLCSIL